MKGISEERLTQLLGEAYGEYEELFICNLLNNECKELQPWQPIESAPKYRKILLYFPQVYGWDITNWDHKRNCWENYGFYTPTHWLELPESPSV